MTRSGRVRQQLGLSREMTGQPRNEQEQGVREFCAGIYWWRWLSPFLKVAFSLRDGTLVQEGQLSRTPHIY